MEDVTHCIYKTYMSIAGVTASMPSILTNSAPQRFGVRVACHRFG